MASSLAAPTSYTELTAFKSMGQPDVILRLQDGGDLLEHSAILKVYSKVLRDVIMSTLPRNTAGSEDVIVPSVIPLGDGDSLRVWTQGLTAMYRFTDGATDDAVWKEVLVRVATHCCLDCPLNRSFSTFAIATEPDHSRHNVLLTLSSKA